MNTLLVFAKEPLPGRVKTRLAAAIGADAAHLLYRAFLRDLAEHLGALADTAVAWWVDGDPQPVMSAAGPAWQPGWSVRRQPAGDLGRRLATAFAAAFAAAPGPVGVVGSDCPHCDTARLAALFAPLATGATAVLLPAEDGGYAGLALRQPVTGLFADIPWSTARVTALTLERLRRSGDEVAILPAVFDVDTAAELKRLGRLLAVDPTRAPHTAAALGERAGWPREATT